MQPEHEVSNHELDKRLSIVEHIVKSLHDDLRGIQGTLRWIATMVAAGLIGAIVNFIVRGGLNG
jgi:hypothetical protein